MLHGGQRFSVGLETVALHLAGQVGQGNAAAVELGAREVEQLRAGRIRRSSAGLELCQGILGSGTVAADHCQVHVGAGRPVSARARAKQDHLRAGQAVL